MKTHDPVFTHLKKSALQGICFLQIFLLTLPLSTLYSFTAHAAIPVADYIPPAQPTPTDTTGASCTLTPATFTPLDPSITSKSAIADAVCGQAQQIISTYNTCVACAQNKGLTDYSSCGIGGFQQVQTYCDSRDALKLALPLVITSTAVVSAAAAACLAACFSAWLPGAGEITQTACTVAGVASALFDLGAQTAIQIKTANEWSQEWEQATGAVNYGNGAIVLGVGMAKGISSLKNGSGKITGETPNGEGQASGNAEGTSSGAEGTSSGAEGTSSGAEGASSGAEGASTGAKGAGKQVKGAACAAFGYFAIMAGLKGFGISTIQSAIASVETSIQTSPGVSTATLDTTSTPGPGIPGGTNGASIAPGNTAITGNSSAGGLAPMLAAANANFPNGGQYGFATAGGLGTAFNGLPNAAKIPAALEHLGSSLGALASQIAASPGSTGAAIAGAAGPGIPASAVTALKDLDTLAANGSLFNVNSSVMSGGGGGRAPNAGAPSNPFASMFGSRDGGGAPAANTAVEFKPAAGAQVSADGDIWHTAFKGTIFQIVSGRLDHSKDQVDQLDWASPLNRALMGLPKAPTSPTSTTPAKKL